MIGDEGEAEKRDILLEFIESMDPDDKAIVFFGKKSKVDDVSSDLCLKEICCQSIHGDRDQEDREQALQDLREGTVRILLATDVASRGIDIQVKTNKCCVFLYFVYLIITSLIKGMCIVFSEIFKLDSPRGKSLRIVGYHFSLQLTATLNLCLIYFKIT